MKRRSVSMVMRTFTMALALAHATPAALADWTDAVKSLSAAAKEAQAAAAKGSSVAKPKDSTLPGSSPASGMSESDGQSPQEIAFAELASIPASPRSGSSIEFLPKASPLEDSYCVQVAQPSFEVGAADYVLKGMRPTARVHRDSSRDTYKILPPGARYTVTFDGLAAIFEDMRIHYYRNVLSSGLDERAIKEEMMRQYERGRAWAEANPAISAEIRREVGKNYRPENKDRIAHHELVRYFSTAGARPKDWFNAVSCMKSPIPQPFNAYQPRKKTMDDLYAEGQARIPALRELEMQASEQAKGTELWTEGCRKYLARREIDDLQTRISRKAKGFSAPEYAQAIEKSLRYHCHL